MPIPTLEERLSTVLGGRYRIERVLARGGMSVVFEGSDLRTHRAVAIKLLRPGDSLDERRLTRFARETELTARLRHPNIVDVLDLGREADGTPYLVMEQLEGQTLAAALESERVISLPRMLEIVVPVMDALTQVHAAGVVHRDLKPDNVFLSRDARGAMVPKLLDFGIAKHADDAAGTRTGAVLGTPEYMAPEQIAGSRALPTTDVWALGAILFRGLCGKAPYADATPAAVLAKLSYAAAPLMAADDVPAGVRAVIDRALLREPERRYPHVEAFAKALLLSATEAGVAVPTTPHALRPAQPAHADAASRTFTTSAMHASARRMPPARRVLLRVVLPVATMLVLLGSGLGLGGSAGPGSSATRALAVAQRTTPDTTRASSIGPAAMAWYEPGQQSVSIDAPPIAPVFAADTDPSVQRRPSDELVEGATLPRAPSATTPPAHPGPRNASLSKLRPRSERRRSANLAAPVAEAAAEARVLPLATRW